MGKGKGAFKCMVCQEVRPRSQEVERKWYANGDLVVICKQCSNEMDELGIKTAEKLDRVKSGFRAYYPINLSLRQLQAIIIALYEWGEIDDMTRYYNGQVGHSIHRQLHKLIEKDKNER